MDMEHLVMQFPPAWRYIFGAMCVQDRQLHSANIWLDHQLSSRHGDRVNLNEFVRCLLAEEPTQEHGQLMFKPRLLHFPLPLQKNITGFLVHNSHRISTSSLQDLVKSLNESKETLDDWVMTNTRLLAADSRGRNLHSSDKDTSYVFTHQTSGYADEILKKMTCCDGNTLQGNMDWTNDSNLSLNNSQVLSTQILTPDISQPPSKRLKTFPLSQSSSPMVLSQGGNGQDMSSSQFYFTQTQIQKDDLSPETKAAVSRLKDWLHSPPSTADENCAEIGLFNKCRVNQLDKICDMLEFEDITEVAMAAACHNIISLNPEIGYGSCVCFAQHCILPKVKDITQNASRLLIGCLTSLTKRFPHSLIEAVLKESLMSPILNSAQSELLCRLIKDVLSNEDRLFLLSCSLPDMPTMEESHVNVLQCLVDSKVEMSGSVLDQFLVHLEQNSLNLAESKKFGKLILAVIRQYSKEFTKSSFTSLSNAVRCLRTFLKKTCETSLNKLQAP